MHVYRISKLREIAFFVLAMSITFFINAQNPISEVQEEMVAGIQPALHIQFADISSRDVDKIWSDYARTHFDGRPKRVRGSSEEVIEEAKIYEIGGANTIDVYSLIEDSGNNTDFYMWIDLGGIFLSSGNNPQEFQEAQKIILEFALEVTQNRIQEELDDQEKTLKKLENDLDKLKRDKEGYLRDIEKAKEAIKEAEAAIDKNKVDQENAIIAIEAQKEVVKQVQRKLKQLKE